MPQRIKHLIVLLPLAVFLFSVNIGRYDLWPPDEPRFAEVAREMMVSGDYLVPRVNGQPYEEKPPLLPWAIVLVSKPFGDVTEVSARIPSIISALAAVLFTYLLGAAMFGPRVALWSALVLMTCFRVWWEARIGRTDMMLTGCLSAALYYYWRWEEDRKYTLLAALLTALIASAYTKGPMGLLFSLLFVFPFYWKRPEARRQLHWLAGSVLVVAAALIWYVPARLAIATHVEAATGNMAANLLSNTLGRFLGSSKAAWPGYYLETLPMDLMPWTLFLPWVLWWIWRRRGDNKMMRFLLCWTVPALIFLSISIGKQAQYLMPLFPAFSIMIAASLIELTDSDRVRWRRVTGMVWGGLLLAMGAGAFVLWLTPYRNALTWPLSLVALAVGLCGVGMLLYARRSPLNNLTKLLAAQWCVLLLLAPVLVFPVINDYKSAKAFCAPVRQLAEAEKELRLYSVGFSREEYVFYARHFHEEVLNDLIGADSMPGADLAKMAAQQKRARKLIAMSVENVPVRDIGDIRSEERDALRQAIDKGIQSEAKHADALRMFESALQNEIDTFAKRFEEPGPAFMFVQEQDWRWITALHTAPLPYTVVRHESVGRRTVLLLANPEGAQAVASLDASAKGK
jgi:4-amino-4-deoxy-L-arabinose transferase-like glycosyltransferase